MSYKFPKKFLLASLLLALSATSPAWANSYPDPNTLDKNTTYNITVDETYTGAINGGTSYTLTKTGAGNMNFNPASTGSTIMNVNLTVNEGTVTVSKAFTGNAFFAGGTKLTVNNGGKFVTAVYDTLGYKDVGNWYIVINEGGIVDHLDAKNESWTKAQLTLNGGTLASQGGGAYHMLGGTKISVTGSTPSTISADISPRNTDILEFNVADGSQLNFTGALVSFNGSESAVKKTGAGTIVMSKDGNFTKEFQLKEGTLQATGIILHKASGLTVSSGATLEVADGGNVKAPVKIGAGSNVNFTGNGQISGLVTLTGDATVSASAGNKISLTGGVTGDYTLTTSGGGTTVLSGPQTALTLSIGTAALELAGAGSITKTVTWDGTGTLTKTGSGVFSISKDANALSLLDHTTSITGGTLELDVNAANSMTGDVTVASGAYLGVNNSGTDAVQFTKTFTGDGGLRKTGTGDVIVTQTGIKKLVAAEGTLQVGNASTSIGTTSSLYAEDGANLKFYVNGSETVTLSGDKLASVGTGTLTKYGSGTLALTCTKTENYVAGNLIIAEGAVKTTSNGEGLQFRNNAVLTINSDAKLITAAHDSLGYHSLTETGVTSNHFTINLYGTWENPTGNESIRDCDINLYGGTITFATGQFDILGADVTFTAKALEGATEAKPTVSTTNSILNLRESLAANANLVLSAEANAQFNVTGNITSKVATNNNGITKTGDGLLVLSGGTMNYTGSTLVQDGTLRLQKALTGTSGITVSDGATLDLSTGGAQTKPVSITGTGHGGKGALYFSDSVTSSGALTLAGNATVGVAEGKTGTISGGVTGAYTLTSAGSGTLTVSGTVTSNLSGSNLALGTGTLSGSLTVPAGGTLTKTGSGTFTLTGDLSGISGSVAINEGGTLEISPGAGSTRAFNGTVSDSAGTLKIASGTVTRNVATTLGANLNITDGAKFQLTVGDSQTVTYAKNFSGTGLFQKYGAGTLTLSTAGSSGILEIYGGKVNFAAKRDSGFFNGAKIYVYEGATLDFNYKDATGYSTPAFEIYAYGGTLLNSVENETLGYQRIHLKNGTMKSASGAGAFDLLTNNLLIVSEAEADATAENPTVSTITAPLKFRNKLTDKGFTFQTLANSRLEVSGTITQDDGNRMFTKTGAGTLVFLSDSSAFSGTVYVNEGTFEYKSSSLASGAKLVLAEGAAIKPLDGGTLKDVTMSGTTEVIVAATGSGYEAENELTVTNGTITPTMNFQLTNGEVGLLDVLSMDGMELFNVTSLASGTSAPETLGVSYDPSIFKEVGTPYYLTAVWQSKGAGGSYLLQVGLPEPATWLLLLVGLGTGVFVARKKK